jgi:fluoroquinolone resistance protein
MLTESHYDREHLVKLQLQGQSIEGVSFEYCLFERCDFSNIQFKNCHFLECRFHHSQLTLSAFPNARLQGVFFKDCKLVGIDFSLCLPKLPPHHQIHTISYIHENK